MKHKFFSLLLSCLLIAFTASGAWAVVYGQSGYELQGYDESTAWEINSAAVLAKIRDDVNAGKELTKGGYFKLTKDIDLTGYTDWDAIGGYRGGLYHDSQPFKGHFDGNGHTIKVKISKIQLIDELPWESYCALFGVVTGDGSIKNLNVEGSVSFSARTMVERFFVSGIVAYLCGGTVENCKFDGSVSATDLYDNYANVYTGGIVGYAGGYGGFYGSSEIEYYSIIKNCKVGSKSATTIKSNARGYFEDSICAGGITAYFEDSHNRSVMSGNWAKVTLNAGSEGKTGAIFACRSGFQGKVSDNTEVDPNESEEPEEPDPLEITGTFKGATLNTSYNGSATVTGGTAPYKWTKSGVPTGMTCKASGATIKLSGKPTEKGTYKFKATATDANKTKISKTFKIVVAAKPTLKGTFNGATLSTSYSGSATVTGGTAPYTWTKSGVPTGMTYKASGATVKLSGKPTKKGSYSFKVTAKDANGASVSKTFKITVAAKPTLTGTFKAGTVGTSYSGTATVTGGTAPYTWKQSGKPAGLTFKGSGTKATLSGKPTTAKSYTFKVTVTDANGAIATKSFTIKISAAKSTLKFSGTFPEGTENEAYSANVKVSGGTSPYTWKKSGTLPDGLKISKNSTGTTVKLSGTPTKDGEFTFKLTATDAKGVSLTKSFTVIIADDDDDFDDFDDDDDFRDFSAKTSKDGNSQNYEPATTELKILSEDVLWQGEGRDDDLFEVKANQPVRFLIGEWRYANGAKAEVSAEDIDIYVDDKIIEGVIVSDEGEFIIPSEFVHDDFKVQAKTRELETIELFISAIEQ